MDTKNKKVFAELNEIFQKIDEEYLEKVPKIIIDATKYFASSYEFDININWDIPLEEQEFEEDTLNILFWLNYKCFIQDEKEKEKLKSLLHNNNNVTEIMQEERLELEELIDLYIERYQQSLPIEFKEGLIDKLLEILSK